MRTFKQLISEAQKITSKDTSRKQVPAVHRTLTKWGVWKDGLTVMDLGGGKFDKGIGYINKQNPNMTVVLHDTHNRSSAYNKKSEEIVKAEGGADIVIISNVLNVIREKDERIKLLKLAKKFLKSGGKLYVSVYKADKSPKYEETDEWVGQKTKDGWQNCQPLSYYVPEVESVFGSTETKKSTIIAKK